MHHWKYISDDGLLKEPLDGSLNENPDDWIIGFNTEQEALIHLEQTRKKGVILPDNLILVKIY